MRQPLSLSAAPAPGQPVPAGPPGEHLRAAALDWFVRRGNADFGAAEEHAFQAWLQADPRHGDAFAHWQSEWRAFDAVPADLWAQLRRDLDQEMAQEITQRTASAPASTVRATRRRVLLPAFAAAAAVAVLAGTGMLAWNHWRVQQAQPLFAQQFGSPRGQQAEVPLPDGSRLRLDTDTQVAVRYHRDRREVRLQGGQAVFSVQADAQRPVQVLAGPLRVTVVGTRFAVRYTPDMPGGEGVSVAVQEGRVRVERVERVDAPAGDAQALLLQAGQQVRADAAGTLSAIAPVSAAGIAPWREHRVGFDDMRLDRALAELARYRDTGLVVRDPAVAELRITGVFDPRDLATFRRVLPLSLPVRLRDADGVTEVVGTR